MVSINAKLKYLRIAPRKTRALASLLAGLSVNEAQAQLLLSPRRARAALLKLLKSAISNAKQQKMEADELYVKEIRVDQGPKFKRWMPRARGGVSRLEKKTSHVTLVLGTRETAQKPRFVIKEKTKKEKEAKKEKEMKQKAASGPEAKTAREPGGQKAIERPGFFQKVFRRKSI